MKYGIRILAETVNAFHFKCFKYVIGLMIVALLCIVSRRWSYPPTVAWKSKKSSTTKFYSTKRSKCCPINRRLASYTTGNMNRFVTS